MPTITERQRADGTTVYVARIRIKAGGKVTHDEAETFARRSLAREWIDRRQRALKADPEPVADDRTIGDLIDWYVSEFAEVSQWQRSKGADLKRIRSLPIAAKRALSVDTATLVDHLRSRRATGTGPATVGNDLIWLGVVFRAARGTLGMPLNCAIFDDARETAKNLRLIARPQRRERRPTAAELAMLTAHFESRDGRAEIPMTPIMWFAIYSARRQAEITRLKWSTFDPKAGTIMVPDTKHPRHKIGNHRIARLSPEAIAIIEAQPRTAPEIFPYDPKSVGSAFTRACHILGIDDLHFHDLRHEGTSRLFEAGHPIHEVALFTLHTSWGELKRYANLKPGDVQARSLARTGDRLMNGSCSVM